MFKTITSFPENGQFYKGNLHSHTTNSDGHLTPEEAAALFKSQYLVCFFIKACGADAEFCSVFYALAAKRNPLLHAHGMAISYAADSLYLFHCILSLYTRIWPILSFRLH